MSFDFLRLVQIKLSENEDIHDQLCDRSRDELNRLIFLDEKDQL